MTEITRTDKIAKMLHGHQDRDETTKSVLTSALVRKHKYKYYNSIIAQFRN